MSLVLGILALMIASRAWRVFERATRDVPVLPKDAPSRLAADAEALRLARLPGDLCFLACIMALSLCLGASVAMRETLASRLWIWHAVDVSALIGALFAAVAAMDRRQIDRFVRR